MFEYKIIHYQVLGPKTEKEWNELGKKGWELVSLVPTGLEINGSTLGNGGYVDGDIDGRFSALTAVFKKGICKPVK